jgi:hypothetical protein
MSEYLPKAISSRMVELFPGLTLEVIVLDDGRRIITEEGMEAFLNWFFEGDTMEDVQTLDPGSEC